jgi:death-on-curing protein
MIAWLNVNTGYSNIREYNSKFDAFFWMLNTDEIVKMEKITVDKIIEIQIRAIRKSIRPEDLGFEGVIRDQGTLEFIVYEGNRKPNTVRKAAWFLYKIATEHPFFQGNKRTALLTALLILKLDPRAYELNCTNEEIADFVEKVGRYESSLEEVTTWIEEKINL